MSKIRVMHFTKVINRYDFIDVIIRFADPDKFLMSAITYSMESNIEPPEYAGKGIQHDVIEIVWGWKGFFLGIVRLARILRKQKIQILHTHHYYEAIMGRVACWLYPGCKHIVGRHYHNDLYLTTEGLKLKAYLFFEALVNRFATAIISPSSLINTLLCEQGVPAIKIKFIPYGFDFTAARYQLLSDAETTSLRVKYADEDTFLIGNFARHHPIKGQMDLLVAFKNFVTLHPKAKLIMVGDGSLRKTLEDWVENNQLTHTVVFLGWRKDGHSLMNVMDVIVHSTLQEAFPQTMIEIMVLRKPLLICPVSGATDVIETEKSGILIPFHSPKVIEEKLEFLYANAEQRKMLGENAHKRAMEFSIDRVIDSFEDVYINAVQ
jgi:glycosyltransferase involved in cell wall biosynthesis